MGVRRRGAARCGTAPTRAAIASWTSRTPATKGEACACPVVPVARTLGPSPGDNTAAIQAAIDEVSSLAPDARRFPRRCAARPGTYEVARPVKIARQRCGVARQRLGRGRNDHPRHAARRTGSSTSAARARGSRRATGGDRRRLRPVRRRSVPRVHLPPGSASGDTVLIRRPVTEAWIRFMEMDKLSPRRQAADLDQGRAPLHQHRPHHQIDLRQPRHARRAAVRFLRRRVSESTGRRRS